MYSIFAEYEAVLLAKRTSRDVVFNFETASWIFLHRKVFPKTSSSMRHTAGIGNYRILSKQAERFAVLNLDGPTA